MPHTKSIPTLAQRRGIKLRLCRKVRGLTLKQMADAAQCDKGLISKLENGDRLLDKTSTEIARGIAHVCGLTVDELFTLTCDIDPEVDSGIDPAAIESHTIGGRP